MAVKIQQSYIYKFNTERLKNSNYNISIDLYQARKNGELISVGESQMLKSLRKITNKPLDKSKIDLLFLEKKNLKKKHSTEENLKRLIEIQKEIDDILFIPEIISIVVKNIKHYEYIIKNGLFINNRNFVRLMCSAGHARRNSVLMIDKNYEEQLKTILNNGRADIEIAPAKFNAYFALSSSTSLEVDFPYFCVIPDCKVKRTELVDYVVEQEDGDDEISTCEKELEFNLFDGQGLISPRQAKVWADNLGLDYIPSAFIIRANFVKGLLVVADFLEFAEDVGEHMINDIYGNSVNIRDMDVILTESQFKMWSAYISTQEYIAKCRQNELGWWVSRYSPKEEGRHTTLNYQFLQVLDLNKEEIDSLCSKTVNYFNRVLDNELGYTLLYLLGQKSQINFDGDILDKVSDTVTKAIILNNDLMNDEYVQLHILNSLKKKIKESYLGKIVVDGTYTFIVSDPYAFMQYIFGLPISGLLDRNEYFNDYWLRKNETKIAAMRSPLVWRSEVGVLNLKSNKDIKHWYKYLNNCVVFNVHGCDMALLGGADFDGDIVCITNQKEIINGAFGGLPVFYETQNAPKSKVIEEELYLYDAKGFNSKVGFLTNCSTTMYSMLPTYDENDVAYKEIIRRLKQGRKEQGAIIDATKGLVIRPIPTHWTTWTRIEESMSQEQKEKAQFRNSLLINKRPIFMQFLYQDYKKDYSDYVYNYNLYSIANFGIELKDLFQKDLSELFEREKEFIEKYKKYSPLLDTDCVVNIISKHMQEKIKETRIALRNTRTIKTIDILKDPYIELDEEKLKKLYKIYKKYKSGKRNLINVIEDGKEEHYKTLEQYNKAIRNDAYRISPDIRELANLAVEICYNIHPSDNKTFAWNVFGEGIIENVKTNRQSEIKIPFYDENGNIEYLGSTYSMRTIDFKDDIYDIL